MSLRIYNTLTRQKEPFVPATPGQVSMYVCGVTPYDLSHVGHARSAVVFDVIRRYLTFRGYQVRFVKNFTDLEDKIIARAAQTGEPWQDLVERYIQAYDDDMAWLGVAPPTEAPRATHYIEGRPDRPYRMVSLIERLVRNGVAYAVDGDVYYEVRRFPAYGRLSGRDLDDLRAGARVDVDERKRDPLDFALWKASKPGEPSWPSPWGAGRPGWHIECSAMSMEYLGESFDLHGGGQDLIFPHHENEIAQSEGATGRPFVRYWIHNGFVNIDAEKMSKSLGNMLNVRELREGTAAHPGGFQREAVRRYLLGAHYRGPLEFDQARIQEARRALAGLKGVVGRAFHLSGAEDLPDANVLWTTLRRDRVEALAGEIGDRGLAESAARSVRQFVAAMDDDFNTPEALGVLSGLRDSLNDYEHAGLDGDRLPPFRAGAGVLLALARTLGLLWWQANPFEFTEAHREQFRERIEAREQARRRRDWQSADAIRAELLKEGVVIEDTPQGPRLRWNRDPVNP